MADPLPEDAQQTTAPQMTEFRFSPEWRSQLCQVANSWVTSGKWLSLAEPICKTEWYKEEGSVIYRAPVDCLAQGDGDL